MGNTATIFTDDNLRVYLRKHWSEQGEELAEGARLGIEIAELIELSKKRNAEIDTPFIDPASNVEPDSEVL